MSGRNLRAGRGTRLPPVADWTNQATKKMAGPRPQIAPNLKSSCPLLSITPSSCSQNSILQPETKFRLNTGYTGDPSVVEDLVGGGKVGSSSMERRTPKVL
ncbi:hypothetical protein HPP92_028615 [Vanilla planifolia]|uniref:Uncharacterized protein n=1 Tax=Vanilla planifolia TaxID=51239 RepID=A0A835U5J9_VANPL|nr:hypothetical protein HPP92_028615 [Vanilla planifolia]KAG0446936.1 hypothetical protein HPP92_028609 [Vanilla planifolia]